MQTPPFALAGPSLLTLLLCDLILDPELSAAIPSVAQTPFPWSRLSGKIEIASPILRFSRTRGEPKDAEAGARLAYCLGRKGRGHLVSLTTQLFKLLQDCEVPRLYSDRANLPTPIGKCRRDFNPGVFGCRNFPFTKTFENV